VLSVLIRDVVSSDPAAYMHCSHRACASQDNILFGRAFDEARYWPIIKACALQDDVDMLDAGDRTELGERGINLSGDNPTSLPDGASACIDHTYVGIIVDRRPHSTCTVLGLLLIQCFDILAGGQKARLALARAAYAAPDVALLDDPLSAVDPRVGRILFGQCIGPQGIMQGEAFWGSLIKTFDFDVADAYRYPLLRAAAGADRF